MLSLILLSAFFFSVNAFVYQGSLQFQSGVNVTAAQSDSRFNYRINTIEANQLGVLSDVSLQPSGSAGNGILAVGIFNMANVPISPAMSIAFFEESASLPSPITATVDMSGATSFVGISFEKIDEVTPSGSIVNTINLANQVLSSSGLQTVNITLGLQYVSYTTTVNGATIALTFVTSSVLGVLNSGGAVMTPTSIETFFEVNGYALANSTNHLRLTTFVGLFATTSLVTFNTSIVSGNGAEQIYVYFSDTVLVNGQTQAVSVSGFGTIAQVSQISSTFLATQLTSSVLASNLQVAVRQIVMDFPANASSFSYDPSMGFGDPYGYVTPTPSGTPTTSNQSEASLSFIPSFALIFFAALFLAIFRN